MRIFVSLGFVFAIYGIMIAMGCQSADTTTAATPTPTATPNSTPSPFTFAQVAGNLAAPCVAISDGSAMNGFSYLQTLTLNSDGSYSYQTSVFAGANCQLGGGNEVLAMSQGGTYSIDGVATTPSGASKMTFTANAGPYVTVYAGNASGSTWAGYLNTYCTGGSPGLSTSATSSAYLTGKTCTHGTAPQISASSLPTFPTASQATQQIGTYGASPHTLTVGASTNQWYPGFIGSYPSTEPVTYSYF